MRFHSLLYRHFGPFADVTLDVSQGTQGLHVIYGPNEAGKTTALRGLGYFLFGFPHPKCDDFRYNSSEQRIGATLRDSKGTPFDCLRRRGKIGTLRAADDRTAIPNERLGELLGGITAGQFEMLFGLNHDQLVGGGHDILKGRGGVGEALFAAGAGLAGLRRIDQSLAARSDGLYKPKGQNQAIAMGLRSLSNMRDELRAKLLKIDVWSTEEEKLRAAVERKQSLEQERTDNRKENLRLEAYRSALPAIGTLQDLQIQLASFCNVRLLDEQFAEDHRKAVAELHTAKARLIAATSDLKRLNQELGKTVPDQSVLAEAQAIARLQGQLSVCAKAERDGLGLSAKLSEHHDKARKLLREYFSKDNIEDANALFLTPIQEDRIRELGEQRGALVQAVQDTEARLEELDATIAEKEDLWAAANEPADTGDLDSLAAGIRLEGPLEVNYRKSKDALAADQRKALAALQQLTPVFSGTLEQASALTAPTIERVQTYQREFDELQSIRRDLEKSADSFDAEVRDRERRIQRLLLSGPVPTEKDLTEARSARDSGVELIRGSMGGHAANDAATAAFINHYAPERQLIDALEQSIRSCDELADQMRREADRVAELSLCQSEQSGAADDRDKFKSELQTKVGDHTQLEQRWKGEWEPSGITPNPPSEMVPWLQQLNQLRDQILALAVDADQCDRQRQHIENVRAQLANAMALEGDQAAKPMSQLLETARKMVATAADQRLARTSLANELTTMRKARKREDKQLAKAKEGIKKWRLEWGSAISAIGLDADETPATANQYLKQLDAVYQELHDAEGISLRLRGIAHDRETFLASLDALRVRLDGEGQTPSNATTMQAEVDRLVRRLNDAQQIQSQRKVVQAEADRAKEEVDAAKIAIEELEGTLRSLREDAGVAEESEISAAVEKSNDRRRLQELAEQARNNIHQQARGQPLDSFLADAQAAREGLEVRLVELQGRVEPLDAEISQQAVVADTARRQLEEWSKASAAAADCKQEMESQVAELRDQITEFAAVNLARRVLKLAIERYRQRNQGSMLDRAQHFFGYLTEGAYCGLEVDEDETGNPVLVAIRTNPAEQVPVVGLSAGTRDQLFLALRLAGIEQHLADREPMPVVVDDVLVNFDADRAKATLICLAELSQRTQVLLFTHHAYLVELAKQSIPSEVVFIHDLLGTT